MGKWRDDGGYEYTMTEKTLKTILTGRGWSELPCSRNPCLLERPIQIGDRVVSHGQRPRRGRQVTRIYHDVCHDALRVNSALIRRYCPVCGKETPHDTEKWTQYTVCTKCGVLIPLEV